MTDPIRRLGPVVRLAPAKLNLTLAVLGRRRDGFHDLHSVMVPLALADRLTVAPLPAAPGAADSLHVEGFDAGPDADNLVLRAIAETRRAVGAGWSGGPGPAPALAARLDKRIPVAAGLGGGSSDAAAALDAALEAWGAELSPDVHRAVAERLGSDVPFFHDPIPSLVEGRGERVSPLSGLRGSPGVLLVTPAVPMSTPREIAAFDSRGGRGDGSIRLTSEHLAGELRGGLAAADLVARAGVLAAANDLLPAAAAVLPELVPFRRALFRLLRRPVGLSGSGPTLWALYDSERDATDAATTVRAAVSSGDLVGPGVRHPTIMATTIPTPSKGTAS